MLSKDDIKGLCVMAPTPCKENAQDWRVADSVELNESARMTENYIQAGVGSIAACGTTGECAALLWEEKLQFIDTVVQVNRKRVPIFAGATALGTKEVVRQMRELQKIGADGAFVGLPLWQTPSLETSVRFFADLSEAVPDFPIMVYSNSMFFKSDFPTAFWEGVAKRAPTVIITKLTYPFLNILNDLKVAGHRINFMPGESQILSVYKMTRPGGVSAIWSSGWAGMGVEPLVALADAILKDDEAKVEAIWADFESLPTSVPAGEFYLFPRYNVQVNRWAANAAAFIKASPTRAPYYLDDLPVSWKNQAERHAAAWNELRKKYARLTAGK
ncbi:MAG TPA: dihydrodipicolinate synthase family protein [Dehalococcoidia bacterium]|nr:dihydrodipicolinate synthase family protein [Dehalococcoidia bacterium]